MSIDITVLLSIDSVETENVCAICNVSMCLTQHIISISQLVVSSLEVSLRWRDGPAADGELSRTLRLLEQRHLDTLAQMSAVVLPRADAAVVLQCAGPCSGAAGLLGLGLGEGQIDEPRGFDGNFPPRIVEYALVVFPGILDRTVAAFQALHRFLRVGEVLKEWNRSILGLSRPGVSVTDRSLAVGVEPPLCSPLISL
ncbi:hypothetical protein DY000_02015968 [Brassica cretica]|uniref:Uncharacterized protein n=1 Tax=Brassica cretica TaxID=69181 RepID=A0ABQ7D5A8_BRACR|nr:hypothetical protein DY000_02015968 [Brassica cretica]